jgi:hypothetical protein
MKTKKERGLKFFPVTFLLFLVCTLTFSVSCKKADDSNNTPTYRLLSESIGPYGTREYQYYPDNKIKYVKGLIMEYNKSYYYNNQNITIIESNDLINIDTSLLTLNSNGLVEKSFTGVYYNNGHSYTEYREYYFYDGNNYLIEEIDTIGPPNGFSEIFDHFYTITDGNITKDSLSHSTRLGGYIGSLVTNYTFYSDKANSVTNDSRGMGFYGKSNFNPIKDFTVSFPPYVYSYEYEYDQKNRIIKSTRSSTDTITDPQISNFIYRD